MADRQTIGGYPRLGHLIAADRPKAAQLWPGDAITFHPVTVDEAHRAARARAAALAAI
jgi:allophanate hydrolase subunit 2